MSESDKKWKPFLESVGMTFLDVSGIEPVIKPIVFLATMTIEEKEEFRKKWVEAMMIGKDMMYVAGIDPITSELDSLEEFPGVIGKKFTITLNEDWKPNVELLKSLEDEKSRD